MQHTARYPSAGDMSSDWRSPGRSPSAELQNQQMLQQQQNMYQLQSTLEAMKLQNIEIQNRLMAAMNGDMNAYNGSPPQVVDTLSAQQRRGALANLQRAQQQRDELDSSPSVRANRLSFNGGDGLMEKALARKAHQSPPQQPLGAPLPLVRGHHRKSSSSGSSASLSFVPGQKMISPSGPTLVLSSPGEAFASPSLGRSTRGGSRPLSLNIRSEGVAAAGQDGSDSSSSSPRTPESEVLSFESMTSVGSDGQPGSMQVPAKRLNPVAPAFTPVAPDVMATPPPKFGSRPFSPPSLSPAVVKPIRQPRGPCAEEDLPTVNFAVVLRAKAFTAVRSKLRGGPHSPTAPTFF